MPREYIDQPELDPEGMPRAGSMDRMANREALFQRGINPNTNEPLMDAIAASLADQQGHVPLPPRRPRNINAQPAAQSAPQQQMPAQDVEGQVGSFGEPQMPAQMMMPPRRPAGLDQQAAQDSGSGILPTILMALGVLSGVGGYGYLRGRSRSNVAPSGGGDTGDKPRSAEPTDEPDKAPSQPRDPQSRSNPNREDTSRGSDVPGNPRRALSSRSNPNTADEVRDVSDSPRNADSSVVEKGKGFKAPAMRPTSESESEALSTLDDSMKEQAEKVSDYTQGKPQNKKPGSTKAVNDSQVLGQLKKSVRVRK